MKDSILAKKFILFSLIWLLVAPMGLKAQIEKVQKRPVLSRLPDLEVDMKCPVKAYPGQELRKSIRVVVGNKGAAEAKDFFVDLVLSSDTVIPVKFANYSSNFQEDVLLKGGREHVKALAAGEKINLVLHGTNQIPFDTPYGSYYLGVVVDPGKKVLESNESNNTAWCPIKTQAQITNVRQEHSGDPTPEIDISGNGFGNTQGSKVVKFGTHILTVGSWSDTYIWGGASGIPKGKEYLVYLEDGGIVISNKYSYILLLWIEYLVPESGVPGAIISIRGGHLGTAPGTKKVMIGSYEAPVISWSSNEIRVTVPAMPAGNYKLFIKEGGKIISFQLPFTVE